MIATKLGSLVTVINTDTVLHAGIPGGESRVVFLDPYWSTDHLQEAAAALGAGLLHGYDAGGAELPGALAGGLVLELATQAARLRDELNSVPTAVARFAAQVGWNMEAFPVVTAAVRGEMLVAGLTAIGVSPASALQKLQPVLALMSVGMFAEAAATLKALPLDPFLTAARVALYSQMLISADAIGR